MASRPARPLIHQHAQFISDPTTMEPYAQAIARAVRPGNVVLDVGAGTGILGYLACQAGASRVYAIEATEILELAREIAEANGFADRITHVRGLSFDADVPARADVAIVSMLARFGVEDGILPTVLDLKSRLLKADALFVPAGVELFAAPVEIPEGYDATGSANVPVEALLGPAVSVSHLRFADLESASLRCRARLEISRPGRVHAVAGWSQWTFAAGVVSGNAPGGRNTWGQILFPLDEPVPVQAGDIVEFDLSVDQVDDTAQAWRWTIRVVAAGTVREWSGQRAGDADRNADHAIEAEVLGLFDGRRTIRTIAGEIASRYPDRFRSVDDAMAVVGELSRRWSA